MAAKGDTVRVARLVRAYQLVSDSEGHTSVHAQNKRRVLLNKLTACLPLLTKDETDVYYAAIALIRHKSWVR